MTDPTNTATDPLDDNGPRTLAWYACHGFYEDGRLYSYDIKQGFANAPSVAANLQVLREAGLHDALPTVEVLRPLLTDQAAWQVEVDKSWKAYEAERGKLRETLSWILSVVLKDPCLSADVLRLFYELGPSRYAITLVSHPGCPDDIRDFYLSVSGTKNDPTKTTKGGEVVVFFLHDRDLPTRYVDLVARRCRKAGTQESAALHANVSRETLTWIVQNGKSDAVKRTALWIMHLRGMIQL